MSKLIKKIILSALVATTLFIGVTPPAMAQAGLGIGPQAPGPWYLQNFGQWYAKVYQSGNENDIFGERYTAAQTQWVFFSVMAGIINTVISAAGCSPDSVAAILTGNLSGISCKFSSLNVRTPVASSKDQNLLSVIFADRPLSGVTYFKDMARKFHIIPEAKAAGPGFGYGALDPIRSLWTAARDVSYGFFVFAIIIMAFMIMFRVKISPQVVVSVQSALPKIAIALLLVTFSYAIAGFLIDLMYVVIGIIALIFSQTGFFSSAATATKLFEYLTRGYLDTGIFGFLAMYFIQFFTSLFVVSLFLIFNAFGSSGGRCFSRCYSFDRITFDYSTCCGVYCFSFYVSKNHLGFSKSVCVDFTFDDSFAFANHSGCYGARGWYWLVAKVLCCKSCCLSYYGTAFSFSICVFGNSQIVYWKQPRT